VTNSTKATREQILKVTLQGAGTALAEKHRLPRSVFHPLP